MTANEETGQAPHARLFATWFLWGSVVGTVLLLIGALVLWRLPLWAPAWIARHSPSLDYILWTLKQDQSGEAYEIVVKRAWEWEGSVARILRERWESGTLGRSDEMELFLLADLCHASLVEEGAQERLSPARADAVLKRFQERSRDDLLAACLILLERREVEFRELGAELLCSLRDRRAVPSLLRRLDDIQPEVSEKVAVAIGACQDPAVIPVLIRYALEHPERNPEPYLNAVAHIVDPIPEEHLIAILEVPSEWARHRVMLRLANQRTSASLLTLVRLTVDQHQGTAARARNLLRLTLTDEDVALLIGYLRFEDPLVQRGSVVVLTDAGASQAVVPLLDLLASPDGAIDPQVERAVLACLPVDDDALLHHGLAHHRPTVRAWTARELGRRQLAGSTEKLLIQADDPEPAVRAAILRALGAMRVAEALPLCERALAAADVDERVAALRTIGELGDARTIPWIRPFLRSAAGRERQASAQAVGQVGQRGASGLCQDLRRLLADPEPAVQESARTALERLSDDPEEVRALEQRRLDDFSLLPVEP